MLEEVTAKSDPEKWVGDTLDAGKRIMGFGHRIYRAEDPRSRILKRTARGSARLRSRSPSSSRKPRSPSSSGGIPNAR